MEEWRGRECVCSRLHQWLTLSVPAFKIAADAESLPFKIDPRKGSAAVPGGSGGGGGATSAAAAAAGGLGEAGGAAANAYEEFELNNRGEVCIAHAVCVKV